MPLVQPLTLASSSQFVAAQPCALGFHTAFQVLQQLQPHPQPCYAHSMIDSNALAPCQATQPVIRLPFSTPFSSNVYFTHAPQQSGYTYYPYGVEYAPIAQPPFMVPSQAHPPQPHLPIVESDMLSSPDVQYTNNSASKETIFV